MKPQTIRVSAPPPPWFAVHMPSITPRRTMSEANAISVASPFRNLCSCANGISKRSPALTSRRWPLAVSTVQPPAAIR